MNALHHPPLGFILLLLTAVLIQGCSAIDNKKKAKSEGRELYKKFATDCSIEARVNYPERRELLVVEKWRDNIIKTGETCYTTKGRETETIECKDTFSAIKEPSSAKEYQDVNTYRRSQSLKFCVVSQCSSYIYRYPNKWNPQRLFSAKDLGGKLDSCLGKVL